MSLPTKDKAAYLIKGGTEKERCEVRDKLMRNEAMRMKHDYYSNNEIALLFTSDFRSRTFEEVKALAGSDVYDRNFCPSTFSGGPYVGIVDLDI